MRLRLSLKAMRLPGRRLGSHLAPLLAKELIEIAARPRSYLLRVLFAGALFALYAMQFHAQLAGAEAGDLAVLGSGKRMLDTLVGALFAAIYLLVPAMVAPAVLAEREAGTLEVLLVSRLQPWQLLAQKLLSRTVAMCGFLVLALPLFGIAYSLGGLGAGELLAAALALLCGTLQVGAWSLYCGARARNALGSVMRSYILGVAALFILVPLALVPLHIAGALAHLDIGWASSYPLGIYYGAQLTSPWHVPLACIPTLASAAVLFLMACRAVEFDDRWTSPPVVQRVSPRESRARALAGDLPGDHPVAWREAARLRRWLRHGHLAWWLCGLAAVMVLGIAALARQGETASDSDATAFLVMASSLVAATAIAAHASALASEERARSTLEVLLATPLEPREIVVQKLSGSRLLARLMIAGIATFCLAETVLEIGMGVGRATVYLAASLGTIWLYLECAAWLGMAIGLRSRTPAAAAMGTIGTLLAWIAVPPIIVHWLAPDESGAWWALLGPARMIELDEYPPELVQWLGSLLINSLWIGAIMLALRWWCLTDASRRLRERSG